MQARPGRPHAGARAGLLSALTTSLVLVLALTGTDPASAARATKKRPAKAPLALTTTDHSDPSVARAGNSLIVISTGIRVPRALSASGRRFTPTTNALLRRPAWASPGDMWAADLTSYAGRWLLYYSAAVEGSHPASRCIGVAEASSPYGTFTPLDERPLACPPMPGVEPAEDAVGPGHAHGAIDPSFTVIAGRPYLLYKTDGRPSTLRAVPLSKDGKHAAGPSRQLLGSGGVAENPVLVQRGRWWYLYTSEGSFMTCDYRTVWRRSKNPLKGWQRARARVLLSHAKQGVCGPGGADIVIRKGRTLMYLHGWTCGGTRTPCRPSQLHYLPGDAGPPPVRALYGLRLGYTRAGFPRVKSWVR